MRRPTLNQAMLTPKPPENLQAAEISDYAEWVRGYLKNGGQVDRFLCDPISVGKFAGSLLRASVDFELPCVPQRNSRQWNVIVESGVSRLNPMTPGNMYFMNAYSTPPGTQIAVPVCEEFKPLAEALRSSLEACITVDLRTVPRYSPDLIWDSLGVSAEVLGIELPRFRFEQLIRSARDYHGINMASSYYGSGRSFR